MTKNNDQTSSIDSTPMHVNALVVPIIEDQIPIPKSQKEALPEMTTDEEISVRAETIKAVSDINGEPIEPTDENV